MLTYHYQSEFYGAKEICLLQKGQDTGCPTDIEDPEMQGVQPIRLDTLLGPCLSLNSFLGPNNSAFKAVPPPLGLGVLI